MDKPFDDYELFQLKCEATDKGMNTEAGIRFLSHPHILHYKDWLNIHTLYLALTKGGHTDETSQELQQTILKHSEVRDEHREHIACHGHMEFCDQAFEALCSKESQSHHTTLKRVAQRGRTEQLALKALELLSKHPDVRISHLADICVDARTPNVAYEAWCKIKESSELDQLIYATIATSLKSQPNTRIEKELAEVQSQHKSKWEAAEKRSRLPREISSGYHGYSSSRDGW